MPLTYRIFPDIGLVYVRYEGHAGIPETMETFGRYMSDPGFRPGQKQLVDLSAVTSWDKDYAALLGIQAKKAEAFLRGPETIMVYYAPTPQTAEMARLIMRSWEDLDAIVPILQDTERGTLEVLGLSETSFDALARRPV
ncbi:hypothetical protein [Vannielia litorea]|uniref:hypothetical protein n=1 Tax=Vannielia litorea TaxID=1217970 RepID=UPI001C97A379|nr:hypothetical protein [Vannielia litorea]MBY6046901.1 hypothetical protein [Vannielia litorea]MBY6074315.1 hypothetical protein [Vannielia litorea]